MLVVTPVVLVNVAVPFDALSHLIGAPQTVLPHPPSSPIVVPVDDVA